MIGGKDETAYRDEILHLPEWCIDKNLALNTEKTKEIIISYGN